MRPPRGPSARPLSRAQSALRPGPPPWRLSPPAPGGGGRGRRRYAAGRVQAGPVLARPGRPRPIAAARPCPAPARGPSPPLVWAGGWRRGPRPVVGLRPVSLLAAWVRGAAAPPPGRSAVGRWPGRWLWPPGRGVGGLACVRAPPAPNPTSPGGGPPSGPAAGWGRPPVWGPPVVLFGLVPAAARWAKGPPAPHPSQRPGEAARSRPGDGGLVSCRLRAALDTGGGNRRPKIIYPTNAAPRRHRDIGNSCASYS